MFQGFTPEAVDFLWGIRMNNNREWFAQHKQQYINALYEPMKALGAQLYEPFMDKPGQLLKVSRIYRDARMHHPDPYKESLWLSIRPDGQWWAEEPTLYLDICPEGVSYGLVLWKPTVLTMERFRRQIAGQPDAFVNLIAATEQAAGQPVTAQCYKRPKETADPRLASFFAWRGDIECTCHVDPGDEMFSPLLAQQAADFFQKLTPLYEYLCSITHGV